MIQEPCSRLVLAQVQIEHGYREANSCADRLARIGTDQENLFILYHDPPMDLLELLSSDKNGLYYSRSIATTLSSS